MLGKDFENEGVQWRVLDVKWSAEYSEIVVFYYDVEDADEEELKAIDATGNFEGCGLDAVEMSTLSEVVKWIKESALVAKGGGEEVGSKRRASRDMARVRTKFKHIQFKHISTQKKVAPFFVPPPQWGDWI